MIADKIYDVLVSHYVQYGIFPSSTVLGRIVGERSRQRLVDAIKQLRNEGRIVEVEDGLKLQYGLLSRMVPTDPVVISQRIQVMQASIRSSAQ